jgi:hypothetical protein
MAKLGKSVKKAVPLLTKLHKAGEQIESKATDLVVTAPTPENPDPRDPKDDKKKEKAHELLKHELVNNVTDLANSGNGNKGPDGDKGEKRIVIGENMSERVIPRADELGADYYKPRSNNPDNWMSNNQQWIRSKIKEGFDFYDVGIDPSRQERSRFYEMEKEMLKKYKIKPK